MLIEYRVKNFRSLREEQVFSLVASKDKTLRDTHTVASGTKAAPFLLRGAVIYGANASGKSNFLRSLKYMKAVVLESAGLPPGEPFNVKPFLLDETWASQPTEFEVSFLLAGVRYQYGFAMNAERILEEHLLVYKAFRPQRWFWRRHDEQTGKDVYEYSPYLKGAKILWEEATRPNALYLSMAVQLNSEALRPVFHWFANNLVVLLEGERQNRHITMQMLSSEEGRRDICSFLKAADISIDEVAVELKKAPGLALSIHMASKKNKFEPEETQVAKVQFRHRTEKGSALLPLEDESSGTQVLLDLAGPVHDILRDGLVLVMDELDTSLHPLLVQELVRLFHDPQVNKSGAQLIFSSHDSSLLAAPDLLRRDQVWLMEKGVDLGSQLVALCEFRPRKGEALARGYLLGRYGGVPLLEPNLGLST